MTRLGAWFGLAAALSACGGGGADAGIPAPTAPAINSQPSNQSAVAGNSVTFSVAASGDAPLTYQWQRNGSDIPGATSTTFATGALLLPDQGAVFSAKVSNAVGTMASNGAVVSVDPTATISLVAGSVTMSPATVTANFGTEYGSATSARFGPITGLTVDAVGNVFVASNGIRRISVAGQVSTLITERVDALAYGGDTLFVLADLEPDRAFDSVKRWLSIKTISPTGVATFFAPAFASLPSISVDGAGGVIVEKVVVLQRVSRAGVASNVTPPELYRSFYGLATGPDGTVYFATSGDTANAFNPKPVIKKVFMAGPEEVLAGGRAAGAADGVGAEATFNFISTGLPHVRSAMAMAVDSDSNVFIAEPVGIRRITKAGVVTTLTGRPGMMAGIGVGDLADRVINASALATSGKTIYFAYQSAVFKLELR